MGLFLSHWWKGIVKALEWGAWFRKRGNTHMPNRQTTMFLTMCEG